MMVREHGDSARTPLQRTVRLAITSLVVVAFAAAGWWVRDLEWPIEVVRIDGEIRYSDAGTLQDIVAAHARDGFFGLDLGALREDLAAMPWVRDVTLRRIWPDVLTVDVHEHRAAARWNEDGWVSVRGEVFAAADQGPEGLPELTGPAGQGAEMLAAYRAWNDRLAGVGLTIAGLHQDERRHWDVDLVDGPVVRLGRSDVEYRLDRFIVAWRVALDQREETIETVDLRYTNGLAVAWQEDAATDSPEGGA